jgi:hypothetical protein
MYMVEIQHYKILLSEFKHPFHLLALIFHSLVGAYIYTRILLRSLSRDQRISDPLSGKID